MARLLPPPLVALLQDQDGVVSRRQVRMLGLDDAFIRRRVRRREWVRVHRGVFVNHTGELTWPQRAWAALLYYAPAVLADESCLQAEGVRTGATAGVIHVAVGHERRLDRLGGVVVHRMSHLAVMTRPHASPPRLRVEDALLRVASRQPRRAGAVAILGDACQMRRTTPSRLADALARHPRLARRAFMLAVLADAAEGAYSVLERGYLTRVERPHRLPTAQRQRRVRRGRGVAYRDVEYLSLGVVVELDGRLGHEAANDRWADMDRDIASAVGGCLTLRVGWRQLEDPCRTAAAVTRLLRSRGWRGQPRACSHGCAVGDMGADQSPDDHRTPLSPGPGAGPAAGPGAAREAG